MIFSKKSRQIGSSPENKPGFSTQGYKYFTPENRVKLRCGDVLLFLNDNKNASI